MKKFFEDFKAFAMRGNVIDMAVGVIIGAAFGSITTSLVNDIFMPLIGVLTGGINFGGLFVALDGGSYVSAEAAAAAGVGTINYGLFIHASSTRACRRTWGRPASRWSSSGATS